MEDYTVRSLFDEDDEEIRRLCAVCGKHPFPDGTELRALTKRITILAAEDEDGFIGFAFADRKSEKKTVILYPERDAEEYGLALRSALVMEISHSGNAEFGFSGQLKRYDYMSVRLVTKNGEIFYGTASHFSAEYGMHIFNIEEEGLSVGYYSVFVSDIASLEITNDEQLRRIIKYEDIMLDAGKLLSAGETGERLTGLMNALESYFTGTEWKEDHSADEAGLLPCALRRSVLSENGIHDLLEKYKELCGSR